MLKRETIQFHDIRPLQNLVEKHQKVQKIKQPLLDVFLQKHIYNDDKSLKMNILHLERNNGTYIGELNGDFLEGKGVLYFKNNDIYIGDFKADEL